MVHSFRVHCQVDDEGFESRLTLERSCDIFPSRVRRAVLKIGVFPKISDRRPSLQGTGIRMIISGHALSASTHVRVERPCELRIHASCASMRVACLRSYRRDRSRGSRTCPGVAFEAGTRGPSRGCSPHRGLDLPLGSLAEACRSTDPAGRSIRSRREISTG